MFFPLLYLSYVKYNMLAPKIWYSVTVLYEELLSPSRKSAAM